MLPWPLMRPFPEALTHGEEKPQPGGGTETLRLVFQHRLAQEATRIYLSRGEGRTLLGTLPYLGHAPEASKIFLLMAALLEALGELEERRLLFEEEYE